MKFTPGKVLLSFYNDTTNLAKTSPHSCSKGPAKQGKADESNRATFLEASRLLRFLLLVLCLKLSNGAPVDENEKRFAMVGRARVTFRTINGFAL